MQKVEAGPYQEFAPAARAEDMTQPMGPLEKGDQALVDAVNAIPEGQHEIDHEDGSQTWLNRDGTFGQKYASVYTNGPSGDTVQGVASIQVVGRGRGDTGGTYASTAFPHESSPGYRSVSARGNTVNEFPKDDVEDRERAQALKLGVAERLNKANEHLAQKALEGAAVSRPNY